MYTITNGGWHTRHNANFFMQQPTGIPEYLLLLIRSPSTFKFADHQQELAPNTLVLLDRNVPYEYRNPAGEYMDDWLFFDDDASPAARTEKKILPINHCFSCQNPAKTSNLIHQIIWEQRYAAPEFKQQNSEMLLQVLLNNMITMFRQRDNQLLLNPHYNQFQNLRLQIQAEPQSIYDIPTIAAGFGVSLSHFYHLYKRFFGQTFQAELIDLRLDLAKELLLTTDLTVAQIAGLSGYNNEVHFYRQFHQLTQTTPREYRERH